MPGRVPQDPVCCSRCYERSEGLLQNYKRSAVPCDEHRGREGQPVPYTGPEKYEPSEWVQGVVGHKYRAYDGQAHCERIWLCWGYDPRAGFWMRTIDNLGAPRETNVSERAIDRTFHRVWEPVA